KAKYLMAEAQPCLLRSLAGDEGLPRSRGLAAVGCEIGVGGDEIDERQRQAHCVCGDLGDYRVGTLADIDSALMQRQAAIGLKAKADRRGIGKRGVTAAIEHAGNASTPALSVGLGIVAFRIGECSLPMGPQRLETLLDADTIAENLTGDGGRRV